MRRAAEQPRTFYGMLARRSLGLGSGLSNEREVLAPADVEAIGQFPAGRRAFALLQVGEDDRAAAEFRRLWPVVKNQPGLTRALMLVAREAGFTDLAADIATEEQGIDGRPHDPFRFPVPRLSPRGGFRLDPALVYAVTRLESNFDTSVVSGAGARGLMQLMPVTAGYISNDPTLAGKGRQRLHEPGLNLDLGQRYLLFLAQQDGIANDLIRILACYNAGTGSFARWSGGMRDQGDPLLFIESIPNDETRFFVQHVLAYTWIYAARLHLPAPSLDALAAGHFPKFSAPAEGATQMVGFRLH
jgi:soluble lytic murein transglycosylase-like protein